MSKRLIALPVAIIAIAVFAPGIANAASFNTAASIAISSTGKAFKGQVSSPAAKCKPNRHVTLKRKNPGGSSFVNIGTDTTSSTGAWSVNTNPIANAQYVAVVSSRKAGNDTCKGVASKVTTARKTTTTIVKGSNNFHGKLGSPSSACLNNRKVNLQRKTIYQSSFSTIGSDQSSTTGVWQVNTNPISGASYRASVVARQVGTATSCMAVLSAVRIA